MGTVKVSISEAENLHLLRVSAGRTLTTEFGPGGVFLTVETEPWALMEIARVRGVADILFEVAARAHQQRMEAEGNG